MWRSEAESRSLSTYLPGVNTLPGTCIGSFTVRIVFLFHSSATVVGSRQAALTHAAIAMLLKLFIEESPLYYLKIKFRLATAFSRSASRDKEQPACQTELRLCA